MASRRFADMSKDQEELQKEEAPFSPSNISKYPYGLCLSLGKEELEKLDVEHSDFCVGDLIHLHAFAQVTSVSETMQADGDPTCRVELQVTHLCIEEEKDEDEEADEEPKPYF